MPWTFAHPAAVLPLRRALRHRLPFGALVVGSLTPDLGFYFGSYVVSNEAHTLRGLLTVCLPSGLVLLALVRALHHPVAHLLPAPHRQRILSVAPAPSLRSATGFLWASFALLLGASTHVFFDWFTHDNGYFVLRWSLLRDTVVHLGHRALPVLEVLQDLGSLLGTLLLLRAYGQWLRRGSAPGDSRPPGEDRWRYLLLGVVFGVAVLMAAPLAYQVYVARGARNPMLFAVRLLVYGTTAFCALLALSAVVVARRSGRDGVR